MRTLILVPARGNSKGIPRKNVRPLAGKPLLAYTAATALAVGNASRCILSTDNAEIAEVGRRYGLEVPFMRPPDLALDETPTLPVVQHALRWIEDQGDIFDAVCLLQVTCPLRRVEQVEACIDLLETSGADSVVTLLPVPSRHNPHWVYFMDASGELQLSTGASTPITRRQDLPAAFHRDGSVYVVRRDVVMNQNSLYGRHVRGVPVDPSETVDIDTFDDLARAERMLAEMAVRD